MILVYIFICALCHFQGTGTIKNMNVDLPSVVSIGEPVSIFCSFDMENESIYSIKMYKGNTEFLHFIPEFSPPYSVYDLKGVVVNRTSVTLDNRIFSYTTSKLDTQDVFSIEDLKGKKIQKGEIVISLASTSLYSQGLYGCEVSADFPSFDTKISRQRLHVIVEPDGQPVIEGVEQKLWQGQTINLRCISGESYPASNLSWYISGKKVESSKSEVIRLTSGLYTSIANLEFTLNHTVTVKCISSIWTYHYQSHNQLLQIPINETEHRPQAIKDKNGADSGRVRAVFFCLTYLLIFFAHHAFIIQFSCP